MSNITEVFNRNLNESGDWSLVNDLLDRARCDLSFWGARVVTVRDNEGSCELSALTGRMLRLSEGYRDSRINLSERQIEAGQKIMKTLERFYKNTDRQIPLNNVVTRIQCCVREFNGFSPYDERFFLETSNHFVRRGEGTLNL